MRLDTKNYRIGESNINNQGIKMTIVEYKNCNNIVIEFEDENNTRKKCAYREFKNGNVRNLNDNYAIKIKKSFNEKNPNLIKYLKNKEDGDKLNYGSTKKILTKCPICSFEKEISCCKLSSRGYNCPICHDSFSSPEKIMYYILKQLNVNFEKEKIFDWSERKRYDFYLKDYEYIIEMNGIQHYKKSFKNNKRTLEQEKINDINKKNIALKNNINKYIIIDCRESEFEYIKKSIINSELYNLFDLSNIDWEECFSFSCSNFKIKKIKEVCDLYNNNMSNKEISNKTNLSMSMITKYLKMGNELKYCEYDKRDFIERKNKNKNFSRSKKVYCKELDKVFYCAKDCFNDLKKIDNSIKFVYSNFCECCKGKNNHEYKGYHVFYKEEENC